MQASPISPGQRYGRLVVLREAGFVSRSNGRRQRFFDCRCDCGNANMVRGGDLRSGNTQSCGCLHRDVASALLNVHGHAVGSGSPTYISWQRMISRCTNPKAVQYRYYGGRGIVICDRWRESFEDFLADMGERPEGMTLDRIDPDGNYEPGNCRWATALEQRHNRRKAA